MGGGDLNLKKSWHPHTMKNQEKVWKAEQAKSQEEKKLNDLRREIEEEKNREELKRIGRESGVLGGYSEGDKKLDWMYKSSTELINREEYLLGRKIDKSFEILQAEEREKEQQNLVGVKQPLNHVEHECVPFSIRAYKNLQNSEQVDLQRKVMEDPLMLIKQREMESRRKILENPVKLKELHRILKTDEKLRKVSKKSKKTKKSKRLKKKHKKRSKSYSSVSSDSDSDSDLDSKLAKKLKGGLLNKEEATSMGINLTKLLDSKFEKISQELDKAAGKSKKHSKKSKTNSDASDANTCYDEKIRSRSLSKTRKYSHKERKSRSVSRDRGGKYNKHEKRYSRSPAHRNYSDRKQTRNSRSTSRSREKNNYKTSYSYSRRISRSVSRSRDKINRSVNRSRSRDRKIRYRDHSRSLSRDHKSSNKRNARSRSTSGNGNKSNRSPPKSSTSGRKTLEVSSSSTQRSGKLTEEEKQAKLKEMMSNAAWREEERTEVVRKHREAYAREEERHNAREFDKDFLNKEVKKAIANQTSVGSRLRANLNNIQRTSAAMNSNFARK
ncbi:CWC25 spliceosome associated protein homolog [Cochliomyia hominivorax]